MLRGIFSFFFVTAIMSAMAPAAQAAWYEASTERFVIYADDSENDIRRFAENLERYHAALALLTDRRSDPPSPSNRLTIFVVGSDREMREFASGSRRSTIAGFYIPRAGASRAFVQDLRHRSGYPDLSTTVLLHEYAHHFLMSSSRFPMPRWLSEGAAEFFASSSFESDGSLIVGRPARHRGRELNQLRRPDIRLLLDTETKERGRRSGSQAFYGQSWLLYHFLTFNEARRGQFAAYQKALLEGDGSLAAAEAAFGDLDVLEDELVEYLRGRITTLVLSPEVLSVGAISLRRLPKGEAKMMEVRMTSQRGVNREDALELVEDAREIAAEYPDDPGVLTALAEAEYDAGDDQAAIAAADRALALDPSRPNAYVQKGLALFRIAAEADDDDKAAAYEKAMAPFSALNARENDHPQPLIHYYRSFAERGIAPPDQARAALERAALLAPFDQRLWLEVAVLQASEGKIALAIASLRPIAANPHGGNAAEIAANLIERLATLPEGEKVQIRGHLDAAS